MGVCLIRDDCVSLGLCLKRELECDFGRIFRGC